MQFLLGSLVLSMESNTTNSSPQITTLVDCSSACYPSHFQCRWVQEISAAYLWESIVWIVIGLEL